MSMRNLITTCTLLFFVIVVNAQNIEFTEKNFPNDKAGLEKALDNIEKGDKFYYQGAHFYKPALPFYQEAYTFNPENAELNYKIGTIYKEMNRPHDAEPYFEKALRLDNDPIHRVEGEITLAEVYHLDGRWDDAIVAYNQYMEWLKNADVKKLHLHEDDLPHELNYVKMRIKQCENGKQLTQDSVPILLENMGAGINTEYPEYSAVINGNEDYMVFTSRRLGSTGGKMPPGDVWQYEDIYFSTRDKKTGWKQSQKLPGEVNSETHEAPVWISADGTKMIIYRPANKGDLYFTNLVDGQWSKPEEIPHVNSKYSETHASMTADGKVIYFTSDNPKYEKVHHGEKGHFNLDIYKIVYLEDKGEWSDPIQVEELNTEYDEECPFIEPDGKTMYFSSQGHTSTGGFDIFKTIMGDDGKFSRPQNMGYPINSPFNDVYIFFSPDGKRGYFDSDRRGGFGEKDIYEMFILSAIRLPLKVEVLDVATGKLIDADIKITEKGSKPHDIVLTNSSPGVYESSLPVFKFYTVSVSKPDYKTFTGTFNTKITDVTSFDTVVIRYMVNMEIDHEPITLTGRLIDEESGQVVTGFVEAIENDQKVGKEKTTDGKYSITLPRNKTYNFVAMGERYMPSQTTFRLEAGKTEHDFMMKRVRVGDWFSMNHIYFKTGKSDIADSSITELELLLEFLAENPNTTVEVSAHTDNIGSRSINQKLSEKRAKSVALWLNQHGVPWDRMKTKGYAFDKPIATNETAEGRSLNRRVEIMVLDNW